MELTTERPIVATTAAAFKDRPAKERMAHRLRESKPLVEGARVPNLQQMVLLALAVAEYELVGLNDAQKRDGEWSEADAYVGFVIDLALTHTRLLARTTFATAIEFCGEWFKVVAALSLAERQFSRPHTEYQRRLSGALAEFEALAALVEFARAEV